MGAGKSSVGSALAKQIGWEFEDLDDRIEDREQRKIYEIFRDNGEAEFRLAEQAALRDVLDELRARPNRVIALGGGAFAQVANVSMIKAAGIPTLFLDASLDELWKRCQQQSGQQERERPLLTSLARFRELHDMRRPHYLKATLRHETTGKTVARIAADLAADLMDVLELRPQRRTQKRRK
jgi:shikimate kinase